MTSTSLWVKLINSAPTKNNKLTALSPVYKVHTHLSLIQAQVYIYGIALQTVKVIESTATEHKASYSQTRHHQPRRLKGTLRTRPAEWELPCHGAQIWAPSCKLPFSLPPPPFLQSEHLPLSLPLLHQAEMQQGVVVLYVEQFEHFGQVERHRFK